MVVARRFGNLVLTLALTFYPLPQERKSPLHVFIVSADHPAIPALVFPRTRRTILPLRRATGENILRSREREKVAAGRMRVVGNKTNHVAGVRWRVIQIIWWPAAWWLTARSGRTQGPGQKANGQRLAGPGPDWPALPPFRFLWDEPFVPLRRFHPALR